MEVESLGNYHLALQGGQFNKLTELTLKNNIQCKLYSKATFQVSFY